MLERSEKHGISCDWLRIVTRAKANGKEEVIILRSFCTAMQHFKCVRVYDTFWEDDWPNSKSMLTILDKF